MGILTIARARVGAALRSIRFSGIGGRDGTSFGVRRRNPVFYLFLPGTRLDFKQKAGDLWKNSVVGICLWWWALSFPEAPPCVKRTQRDGSDVIVPGHGLARLLKRPNPRTTGRQLWAATILSLLCEGNGYWLKVRNGLDEVVELWYVPHYEMEPRWPADGMDLPGDPGSGFISHYERFIDGQWSRVERRDVVHFRYVMDPDNPRKGMAPLGAQLREVFTDNAISTYYAALLENAGVCTLMISPAELPKAYEDEGDEPVGDVDEAEKFAKVLRAKTGGDELGKHVVVPTPIKVDRLAYNPEEMLVKETSAHQASRICASMLLDPMVVGLPSETNTHYDNREQAEKGAWNNGVIPTMGLMSDDLQLSFEGDWIRPVGDKVATQLRADLGEFITFDLRNVRALQVDENALWTLLVKASGGAFITQNEAREKAGYPKLTGDEEGPDGIGGGGGAFAGAAMGGGQEQRSRLVWDDGD